MYNVFFLCCNTYPHLLYDILDIFCYNKRAEIINRNNNMYHNKGFSNKEWDQWVDAIETAEDQKKAKSFIVPFVIGLVVMLAIVGAGILEHFYLTI